MSDLADLRFFPISPGRLLARDPLSVFGHFGCSRIGRGLQVLPRSLPFFDVFQRFSRPTDFHLAVDPPIPSEPTKSVREDGAILSALLPVKDSNFLVMSNTEPFD